MSTAIRRYYSAAMSRATEPEKAIETTVEALAVGGILGAVQAQRVGGLDMASGVVPMDLTGGMLGVAASAFAPVSPQMRQRIREASGQALAIGVYRKASVLLKTGATVAGEMGAEDPIVKAAKAL